jgi:predicted TIM-barrel fold metal-dependent hydrolase
MVHRPILDSHVHAWDAGRLRIPWTASHPGFHERSWGAYREACAGTGITESVLVEADAVPEDRRAEAEDFAARCARGDAVGAVACLDPRDEGFARDARAFAALTGMRALRWIARTPETARSLRESPHALEHLRLLGELGLAFDLNVPTSELLAMSEWVAKAPRTRIVLDHCGYADAVAFGAKQGGRAPRHDARAWERAIAALAAQPQIACKMSGLISPLRPGTWTARDLAPIVERIYAAFGWERVMFGSDWPVCTFGGTLREWHDALQKLVAHRPERELAALFGGTARRWYGLEAAARG